MIPKSEVRWNNERSLLKINKVFRNEKFIKNKEKRCVYYKTFLIAVNAGTFPHLKRRLEASGIW